MRVLLDRFMHIKENSTLCNFIIDIKLLNNKHAIRIKLNVLFTKYQIFKVAIFKVIKRAELVSVL